MTQRQKIERIKSSLYGKICGDTTTLVIEIGQESSRIYDDLCVVDIVVLEDDGDTVAYRYSEDGSGDEWSVGSIEDVVAAADKGH